MNSDFSHHGCVTERKLTFIDTFHSWFEYEGRDAEYTEKYDVTIPYSWVKLQFSNAPYFYIRYLTFVGWVIKGVTLKYACKYSDEDDVIITYIMLYI